MSAATEPDSEPSAGSAPQRAPGRIPGLALLLAIVALGFGAGAGYFRFAAPRARAEVDRHLNAAPSTDVGRVALWVEWAEPTLLERLRQARISAQQPWIVTHTVLDPAGGAPAVWGIESDSLAPGVVQAEGLRVVVRLAAPRLLARTTLVGDHARSVPSFSADAAPDDAPARLQRIAEYALAIQREKLEEDIQGASLMVEVAGDASDT